jgi:hypothetical protein
LMRMIIRHEVAGSADPRLIFSASENVDEGRHSFRADESAGALDQHDQSEQKEKGDPDPDRGLKHPPEDEQKRDRRISTVNAASPYIMPLVPRVLRSAFPRCHH